MTFSTVIVASIISLTPLIFFYCKIQEAGSGGAQAQASDGSVSRAKARSLNPEGFNDNLSSTQIESAIQSSHSQIDTIIIKFSNLTQTRISVQSPMPGAQDYYSPTSGVDSSSEYMCGPYRYFWAQDRTGLLAGVVL